MVADARPRTVAIAVETIFNATPTNGWDTDGTEIFVIDPDPSGAAQALVDNENYVQSHLGMHGKLRGLKNSEVSLGSLYLHGSPNSAAEAAQATNIPLADICENAWAGKSLGFAGGIASGTASSIVLEAAEGLNFTEGDWIMPTDADDSEGDFVKIDSLTTDTITLTTRELTFTPDAGGADTANAVIVLYPHGAGLREHTDSAYKSMAVFMKGEDAEDLYEFLGCKINLTMAEIVAGEPTKLEATLVVTSWDNDGLSAPNLTTTPAGEAPGLPGTGDDTFVLFEDKGTTVVDVTCYGVTPNLALVHERVQGPCGTEGTFGHIATGIGESTVTLIVPYDNAYQAEFEADTRKHLLVQVGSGAGAWGIYFPDLELKQPKRVDTNGVTTMELEMIIHENTSGTTDRTRAPWELLLRA